MAETALAPRSWFGARWWGAVVRALTPKQIVEAVSYGADYAPAMQAAPSYDVGQAMAAYAAFPWVVACLDAKATDLSGLPLRVTRGRGKTAEVLDEHPVLALLDRPSRQVPGLRFRRQMVVDFDLAGNWYAVVLFAGRAPASLVRLHPERVRIVPDTVEGIGWYEHDLLAGTERFLPDQVLHAASMSYEAGPASLYGQGKIAALHEDLNTDLRAQRRAADIAKTGRPDVIISPKADNDMWTPAMMTAIKERYAAMIASGGALVIGGGAKVDLPAWNPRDMEFEKVRLMARDAVLAAFHCPPSRVGLPTANYATQREQMRTYWEALRGDAALFDEEFTRLASLFDAGVSVSHDFSAVEALQESRTDRLARVVTWTTLGADPAAAAAYEGFDDAPLSVEATPVPATPTAEAAQQESVARLFGIAGSSALAIRREPLAVVLGMPEPEEDDPPHPVWEARLVAVPADEDGRAVLWRGFAEALHEPAERTLHITTSRFLLAQRRRIVARVPEAADRHSLALGLRRDLMDDLLAAIFPEASELAAMRDAFLDVLRRVMGRAMKASFRQLGEDIPPDPARFNAEVDRQLAQLVGGVSDTTKADLAQAIRESLAAGESVNDLQARIQRLGSFSPSRALLIARTEATKSVNAGAVSAYHVALDNGIALTQQWLTARDSHVRDDHRLLDGQEVEVGHAFTVPSGSYAGATARWPGDFESAAMSCNCRCTLVPIV